MSVGLGGIVTSVPGVLGLTVVVGLVDVEVGGSVGGVVDGSLPALSISPELHFVFSAQSQ